MKKFIVIICSGLFVAVYGQTFVGGGGPIPDFPAGQVCFPINVTGLTSNLYSNYGLVSVNLNITHPYDSDLEIVLISPNSVQTILSSNNGGSGANYTNTTLSMSGATNIAVGTAPFTGTFIPEESFYAQNVGQNGNGTWYLCITDEVGLDAGNLNNWSITFGTGATGSPDPGPNPIATDLCANAPLVCNLNGYTGSTYSTYTWTPANEPSGTAQPTPGPAGTFCGTDIDNSSWIKFQASSSNVSLNIDVVNCTGFISGFGERGIQVALYESSSCGSSPNTWVYSPSAIPPSEMGNPPPNDEDRPSCYGDGIYGLGNVLNFDNLVIGNIYYVMFDGWAGNQCDYTISVSNGIQVVTITPDSNPICEGDTIDLVASAPGTLNTFTWTSVPGGSYPSDSVITVNPGQSTVYTVTASGICGAQTVSLPVTVIPSGNPAWSAPPDLCDNSSLVDLTTLISGTTGGSWTGTGVVGSQFDPTGLSGPYTVTYTTGTSPCQKLEQHTINVLPTPHPSISIIGGTNICEYQTVQLSASSSVGGSYLWNTGSSSTSIVTDTSGVYIVSVTNANGCSDADTLNLNLTVYPQSNPVISPTNPVICNGQSITLSTSSGFSTYNWNNGSTTLNTQADTTGNYIVIVQDANGCLDTSSTLVVSSNIDVEISGDSVLCPGEVTTLIATGGASYLWSTSETTSSINVNAPGNFIVTSTNVLGCTDSDTVSVFNSPPVILGISGDSVLCPGEITTLTATGGTTYLWSTSDTSNTIIVGSAGTYQVSSQNSDGCPGLASIVIANSNFNPDIMGDTVICNGELATITASGGGTYLWNTAETSSTIQPIINFTSSYSVIITNGDGCMDTLYTLIHVYTDYNAGPSLMPDTANTNYNTTINIPVTDNDAIINNIQIIYGPNNGSASVSGNEIIYIPNAGFNGNDTLLYVSCDATCLSLCDTTWVIIDVNGPVLDFPEFISPNGDLVNDFWDIGDVDGYPENELTILNRWGDPLYHAQPYNNEWYGQTNMGIPTMTEGVTDGTYFFVFISAPGEEPVKGFIEIRK